MRTILLSTVLFVAGLAAALGGAGQAAAGVPVAQPDQGRLGWTLSHDETAALADGPVPALVTKVVPQSRMGAGLHPETGLYRDDKGAIHASLRQVIMEAAEHPDGTVTFFVNAPGTRGSRVLDIYQRWN